MFKRWLTALLLACLTHVPFAWSEEGDYERFIKAARVEDFLKVRDSLEGKIKSKVIEPEQLLGFAPKDRFSEIELRERLTKLRTKITATEPLCDSLSWGHLKLPSKAQLDELVTFINEKLEPDLLKRAQEHDTKLRESSRALAFSVMEEKGRGVQFWNYLRRLTPRQIAKEPFQEALPNVIGARLKTMKADYETFLARQNDVKRSASKAPKPLPKLKSWSEAFDIVSSITDKRNRQLGIFLLGLRLDTFVREGLIDGPEQKWQALHMIMTSYQDLEPQKLSGPAFVEIVKYFTEQSDAETVEIGMYLLNEAVPHWTRLLEPQLTCAEVVAAQ